MGIYRHYFKNEHFMLSRFSGEINNRSMEKYVLSFNEETTGISDLMELADCRDMKITDAFTVRGAINNAKLAEVRMGCLTAILIKDSSLHYGMARAVQTFLEDKRKNVEIFMNMDDAVRWLTRNNEEEISRLKQIVENT